jgi:hypothetical protein
MSRESPEKGEKYVNLHIYLHNYAFLSSNYLKNKYLWICMKDSKSADRKVVGGEFLKSGANGSFANLAVALSRRHSSCLSLGI